MLNTCMVILRYLQKNDRCKEAEQDNRNGKIN